MLTLKFFLNNNTISLLLKLKIWKIYGLDAMKHKNVKSDILIDWLIDCTNEILYMTPNSKSSIGFSLMKKESKSETEWH